MRSAARSGSGRYAKHSIEDYPSLDRGRAHVLQAAGLPVDCQRYDKLANNFLSTVYIVANVHAGYEPGS